MTAIAVTVESPEETIARLETQLYEARALAARLGKNNRLWAKANRKLVEQNIRMASTLERFERRRRARQERRERMSRSSTLSHE